MDRYFIVNDFENADRVQKIKPRIGIYDKWHHQPKDEDGSGGKTDGTGGEGTKDDEKAPKDRDDGPIIPPIPKDEGGGIGAFWTIFLILFFLAGAGVLVKLYGKQCLERIE